MVSFPFFPATQHFLPLPTSLGPGLALARIDSKTLILGPLPGDCCPVGLSVASTGLSRGCLGRRSLAREQGRGGTARYRQLLAQPCHASHRAGPAQPISSTNLTTACGNLARLLALGLGIVGGGPRSHWRYRLVLGSQKPVLHLARGTLGCGISPAATQKEEDPLGPIGLAPDPGDTQLRPAPVATSQGGRKFLTRHIDH